MASFDGELSPAGEIPGELEELFAVLGFPVAQAFNRQDAMAHYLSGEEGWRTAREALRGTFAKASPIGTGLTGDQDK